MIFCLALMSKAVEVVLKILLSIYGNQMHGIIRQTTVIMIVVSAIKSKKKLMSSFISG